MDRATGERELFIEQIAELTPVVISVFDLVTGRDIYITRDVATMSGYTHGELAHMKDPVSALWHPDDSPLYGDYVARWKTMADGEIFEFQFRIRHRDGRWRWLATRVMPFLRSEEGDVRQVVAATLDVTAWKQAEKALAASEERFRRCFELGLIGMAITSPEKGCIEVNDETCKILGYERSELLKKTWAELTHPDDLAADTANFERVMRGQIDGYSMDKRWIRKDGEVIYTTISVKCLRREDGAVDCFVALLQDITARKRVEEALARSRADLERRVAERTAQLMAVNEDLRDEINERKRAQEKLRRSEAYLAEAQRISHMGSWARDASSGEVFWSLEVFRILGLDPEAFDPSIDTLRQLVHPEDLPFVEQNFLKAMSEESDFEEDFRIVVPSGSIRHVHNIGHPVLNESGELVEFVGSPLGGTARPQR